MRSNTLNTQFQQWFESGRIQTEQMIRRSARMRTAALTLANVSGSLLMLSPLLATLAFGTGALHVYQNIQGPLDWFLFEVLAGLTAFAAYLGWQFLQLRPEQPAGVCLDTAETSELAGMLDRRARHFKVSRIKQIHMTSGTQLDVVGSPLLAVPLLHRHTLCIGAPLLFFIGRAQFRLGLAAAVATAAKRRSSLSGWLSQCAEDWPLIVDVLENNNSLLSRLLRPGARHIAATVDRLGQPLRSEWRQQQARWVLENSDENSIADLLSNQLVAEGFLDKQYWPMILKAAERSPTPVVKAFSHLPLLMGKILNKQQADRWLMQSQAVTGNAHAGVRDLLAELRIEHLTWSGLPEENAFDSLLGDRALLKQMDSYWQKRIEPEWQAVHRAYQQDETRFSKLRERLSEQGLRGKSALNLVRLAPRFVEEPELTDICQSVYAHNTDDAKVCFACGLTFLRTGVTQDGTAALQRAATLEPSLAKRAQALIQEHRTAWVESASA